MYGFEPQQAEAGGDIRPSRFVKQSGAADNTILETDANEMCVGISGPATMDAPIPNADGDLAEAGDPVTYHPEGTICKLQIGSGGITRGAQIKSDADGKGVAAATTGNTMQWVGAIALESASENEFAMVLVKVFPIYPALG